MSAEEQAIKRLERQKRAAYYATHRAKMRAIAMRYHLRLAKALGITLEMLEDDRAEAERRIDAWVRM